ncbi:mycothiol system anti-sigma-R factor [Kribbia dieselivorans]|uniref:mycothiol system anti-sigma-R factor n=1 Tax=Kribbia dieselivorans TaxID=331526 RepID=UPI001FDEE4B2|nr:mycothiol system anti-sigma-R factor [Kribbia dieselivorans]
MSALPARDDDTPTANCSDTMLRIYEYLDGEMTPADTHRIAAHIEECAPCLAQHDLDRALKALVRRSCQCEEAPEALRLTIMERITHIRVSYE